MRKNRKLDLQVFAAETGVITTNQITINPREVDFVTSFGRELTALTEVMGITRPIKKTNGTALISMRAKGELQSGDVAEGDVIPLSQFEVEPETYDTIRLKKYRKAVTIESIEKYGYTAAVDKTDEEFKVQLQDDILAKFYNFLLTGQLTSKETTFQMALSMAIGRVKDRFKKMHKSVTGVAAFVNTLDVYEYVGAANITVQTVFGMDYIKNFLGANIVFISSEIPKGRVIATPANNIIAYYVDPGDSEYAQAGLSYTTDAQVPYIGYHTEGNYQRAQSESFALSGITLFAEYINAVAVITVSGATDLKKLTVTPAQGATSGTITATLSGKDGSGGNILKYKLADAAVPVVYGENVRTWKPFTESEEIRAETGQYLTVAEADRYYKALAAGNAQVTAKE